MVEAPEIQTSKTSSAVKLGKAIRRADKLLKPFRSQRMRFIKQYAGRYYGKGFRTRQSLTMLYSLVSVLVPNVIIEPEVSVTTGKLELDRFTNVFRADVNKALEEVDFADATRDVVVDSLFGPGIMKTALAPSSAKELGETEGYLSDPGKVFVSRVSFENYICDMDAHRRPTMGFEGNRYTVTLEEARASGIFKNEDELQRLSIANRVHQRDRADQMITGKPGSEGMFKERIELADIWLPEENAWVTVAGDPDQIRDYIVERQYQGPERGPFDMFGYAWVPDNLLPIAPIASVYDLYLLINEVARKIMRQATRQKNLVAVAAGHEEAGGTIKNADDGDVVFVADPDRIKEIGFGGPDDDNYRVVAWLRDYFNLVSGNPELLGGLGPQANTLGQDEMNRASAGVRIADWRRQVQRTASSVARKVAWYEWTDPVKTRELTLELDSDLKIPLRWTPEAREGDFLDYNIEINAFARKSRDPDEQYRRTIAWLSNVILPLAQMGAPQGLLLDVERVAKVTGVQLGIEQAEFMFRRGQPTQAPALTGGSGGGYTDNRVVRRLAAKPPPVKSAAEEAGVT